MFSHKEKMNNPTMQHLVLKDIFEKDGKKCTTDDIIKSMGINRNQVHKAISHLKFRGLIKIEKPKPTFPLGALITFIPNNPNLHRRIRRLIYGEIDIPEVKELNGEDVNIRVCS